MAQQKSTSLIKPEATVTPQRTVVCLGHSFPSEEARREFFLSRLRAKLQDPAFRGTGGFPLGDDQTILDLSDPPYFTACPNPFLPDLITHHGRPHDPEEPYPMFGVTCRNSLWGKGRIFD